MSQFSKNSGILASLINKLKATVQDFLDCVTPLNQRFGLLSALKSTKGSPNTHAPDKQPQAASQNL